jgi:hypothetical protein
MSARMDAPVECACDELDALQTIEMMVRRLMAEQVDHAEPEDKNQIQSQYRFVFINYLARLDSMRAINQAKETA